MTFFEDKGLKEIRENIGKANITKTNNLLFLW